MQLSKTVLQEEQLAQMLSFNQKTTISNLLVAALMCYELWSVVPRWMVLAWLSATIAITGVRFVTSYYFLRTPTNDNAVTARRLAIFRAGVMLSALVWGLSAWLVYGHEIDKYELFVAYMIAGISAATAIDYLIDLVSALSYMVLAVVPMIWMFFVSQDSVLMIMGAAATGYLLFTGTSMEAFSRKLHEGVRLRREAEHLAFYDDLTGLPNRRLLLERLEFSLLHSERKSRPLAVMFIDLDRFKAVNDQYGHGTGDILLQKFAARLKSLTRDSDTVARISGDEFVIVLENLSGKPEAAASAAKHFAEKLLTRLQVPYELSEGTSYESVPSIGIALSSHPENRSAQALIKNADIAMYKAKKSGGNAIKVYGCSTMPDGDDALLLNDAIMTEKFA